MADIEELRAAAEAAKQALADAEAALNAPPPKTPEQWQAEHDAALAALADLEASGTASSRQIDVAAQAVIDAREGMGAENV